MQAICNEKGFDSVSIEDKEEEEYAMDLWAESPALVTGWYHLAGLKNGSSWVYSNGTQMYENMKWANNNSGGFLGVCIDRDTSNRAGYCALSFVEAGVLCQTKMHSILKQESLNQDDEA